MVGFVKKVFWKKFQSLPGEQLDEEAMIKALFCDIPEEEQPAAEASFYDTVRIMKARSYDEVKDISLERIIACFEYQQIFDNVLTRDKGGKLILRFVNGFASAQNHRARRVL